MVIADTNVLTNFYSAVFNNESIIYCYFCEELGIDKGGQFICAVFLFCILCKLICSLGSVVNKLNLFINKGNKINNNMLKGVYFNNERRPKSKDARTKYDANTMRVLGITSDGKLGFIISKEEYLAANEAYLNVPAGSPEEFELMTEEQLAAYKENEQGQSINSVKTDYTVKGVFSITGLKVADKVDKLLPKGIYIVNGKKIIIK